jgi:putative inorganic carbon (HCO3(-)) transporter
VKYLEEKDTKLLPVIAVIFTAFVCAKTMGGYVTFIVTMVIIGIVLVISSKEKKQLLIRCGLLILTLTISFILINIVNDNAYIGELSTFNVEMEELQNRSNSFGSYRGVAWKMAIRIIKDYPIFGIGPDSFGIKTIANQRYYWSECLKLGCYFDKAHCEYLQIAATTGIPSLICYISFISLIAVGVIKKYIKALKEKKKFTIYMIVGASLFAYLMQAGANISITCIAPIFWIMLGVAANLCNNSIDK